MLLPRFIPLTQGQWAIVDATDYDRLMRWNWQAQWISATQSYYAVRTTPCVNGKRSVVFMHREVFGSLPDGKHEIDHIDHNSLNNCRSNLRAATHTENMRNMRLWKRSSTGYKGVRVHHGKRYNARIRVNGKSINIGYYPLTREGLLAASEAYRFAADLHFGEFAFSEMRSEPCEETTVLAEHKSYLCGLTAEKQRCVIRADSVTQVKGVGIKNNRYYSHIRVDGLNRHLGYFPLTPEGLKSASEIYQFAEDLYRQRSK